MLTDQINDKRLCKVSFFQGPRGQLGTKGGEGKQGLQGPHGPQGIVGGRGPKGHMVSNTETSGE